MFSPWLPSQAEVERLEAFAESVAAADCDPVCEDVPLFDFDDFGD